MVGLWHALYTIGRQEGAPALYRGFGSVALFTTVGHSLYFGAYEKGKSVLKTNVPAPLSHLMAGFCANGVGAIAWCPMEVVKQRLQAQSSAPGEPLPPGAYRNTMHGVASLLKKEGVMHGLYRGYWAGLATYGPFSGIYFAVYEASKSFWLKKLNRSTENSSGSLELPLVLQLSSGALAGAVGAAATAPVDMIKTRMQVGK